MPTSLPCRVTLTTPVCPTITLPNLPDTLRMVVWTRLTAVEGLSAVGGSAVFPLVRMGVVLAGAVRVAVPLAQHLFGPNFSMAIIAAVAGVLPVVMFLMRPGVTLTSPPSTFPLPT